MRFGLRQGVQANVTNDKTTQLCCDANPPPDHVHGALELHNACSELKEGGRIGVNKGGCKHRVGEGGRLV
jgi:hypothetical protein